MKEFTISVDGVSLDVPPGITVAAALVAANRMIIHRSVRRGRPRGMFCGMGVCFECLVSVNGRQNLRACLVEVEDGMLVETRAS